MLQNFFYYRPFADRTLCHFLKKRLSLPDIDLQKLFVDFDQHPISFHQFPQGAWSTPLADIAVLLKLTVCSKPKRLMEVGSFRGYTALYLAQHTADNAQIVTIDQYPEHGEAYRNTFYEAKIERRVGQTTKEIFQSDAPSSYDLIFIDADHSYDGVKNDTELVLPLIAPSGYIVWHDYANWGYFDGKNGVPEYLGELASKLPIAHIIGSDVAIYSPAWGTDRKKVYLEALQQKVSDTKVDVWKTPSLRG
jgi:Methyltransferase domain